MITDEMVEAAARAMEEAEFGYNLSLTRLVDGVHTYTLTYSDGSDPIEFDDMDAAYAHVAGKQRAAQAIAALTAALAKMWRPIESAPKDGTAVLISDVSAEAFEPAVSRFRQEKWETSDWDEASFVPARWMSPTHWMPMPSPPETEVEG